MRRHPIHGAKLGLLAAVACAAFAASGCPKPAQPPGPTASAEPAKPTGRKAPDFALKSLDGTTVRLSDHAGKVVLLDLWSTICDPCLQEMPELAKIYAKYKDQGFVILAISQDGPDTVAQVRPTAHDKGMTFPVLLDEQTSMSRYYKGDIPIAVLVDKSGTIIEERSGYHAGDPDSMKSLVAKIEAALAAP